MWAERFFWGFSGTDLFVFWVVFWFLIVVSGSVWPWFSALSMLPKVTFDVAKSDAACC